MPKIPVAAIYTSATTYAAIRSFVGFKPWIRRPVLKPERMAVIFPWRRYYRNSSRDLTRIIVYANLPSTCRREEKRFERERETRSYPCNETIGDVFYDQGILRESARLGRLDFFCRAPTLSNLRIATVMAFFHRSSTDKPRSKKRSPIIDTDERTSGTYCSSPMRNRIHTTVNTESIARLSLARRDRS